MTAWIIISLIVYVAGFFAMVYRIGMPLRGSLLVVLLWAVVVCLWPITLPISIIIDLSHRV